MKTRFPSILGVFAAILMVASFVVPMNIAAPAAVSADPGIMKWDTVTTPAAISGKNDIVNWHGPANAGGAGLWDFTTDGYGNEIIDMAVGNDGMTVVWIARGFYDPETAGVVAQNAPAVTAASWGSATVILNDFAGTVTGAAGQFRNFLYYSNNSGISASSTRVLTLIQNPLAPPGLNAFQVAIAPDDPKIWMVTTDNGTPAAIGGSVQPPAVTPGPRMIWVTYDAGATWDRAFDGQNGQLEGTETIRCIDISADYGGKRDLAFGTIGGTSGGRWVVRSSAGFNNWTVQLNPEPILPFGALSTDLLGTATTRGIAFQDIKFSPTYNGDSSIAIVFSVDNITPFANAADGGTGLPSMIANGLPAGWATYINVAQRDLQQNNTLGYSYAPAIELRAETMAIGSSPSTDSLNNASLQLPSDFSGQSASLRRAYISLDAYNNGAVKGAATELGGIWDGIIRVDDTTRYVLMDTTSTLDKSIYTIAYFGTYASGKLLAGERMGYQCTATVPTWFTDSPTTCPIPCWYPALKPTTGAANQVACTLASKSGDGAAIVGWNADGSLGLVSTGSLPATVNAASAHVITTGPGNSPAPPYDVPAVYAIPATVGGVQWWRQQYANPIPNDESAFAISRNNGETWNQIALIDTTIDWFNDVAVAPDCTTIYLASANRANGLLCDEFDSVWRATINPNVAAPLPAVPPLGTYWERVYLRPTQLNCTIAAQTDLPILRLVNSCTDKKDGEIVGWAAQGTTALAWSPDYGDFWASITPRHLIQDFAFESSTTMYVLNGLGMVQRLPYTGTTWSTNLASAFSNVDLAHTIVAVPDGKVLVGAATGSQYPASYSADKGVTFGQSGALSGHSNVHVIFDVDFKNNSFVYIGDDTIVLPSVITNGTIGSVYRNTAPSWGRWTDNDMMSVSNGNAYIFANIAELAWNAGNNPPHIVGQFGIVQAWTGEPQPALYSAHQIVAASYATSVSTTTPTVTVTASTSTGGIVDTDNITPALPNVNVTTATTSTTTGGVTSLAWSPTNSAVCRTLKPRNGMPKPGIQWDCLDVFAPLSTAGVRFTLEPSSLKYCGCCTLDTNTTLYAIDNERAGGVGRWWRSSAWVSTSILGVVSTYGSGYAPFLTQVAAPVVALGSGPQGMLWAYTDCLAKKGPILKSPADKFLIGADPVTGRNQQIDLSWEQLCLSTWYQLQVAKDPEFTLRINPAVSNAGNIASVRGSLLMQMDATNMTSPAGWIAPGALPEAGAIYYWRIRSARSATQQIAASPWSEVRSFTVKAGFIVNTPYYGVQLLAPNNGCIGCKVKPASFSWSPWKEATKYQFDLAKDPEFKTLVVTATTTTTGYEYSGTLDYSTNYFWRVKALEVNGLNIPSDWSATFSMQTEPAPAPPAPPPAEPATPVWVWVIIAIGAILVIVTLVLIFKTRRV